MLKFILCSMSENNSVFDYYIKKKTKRIKKLSISILSLEKENCNNIESPIWRISLNYISNTLKLHRSRLNL